jgi:multidrug efflux pump
MDITRGAIEKNRITAVVLILILAAGVSAYRSMPRDEDPGFFIRTAQVTTFFPGASPDRVEMLVTDKLEKVIQEIPEIDFINSTSKTGISVVNVNILESHKTMRPIWDDLRRKVDRAKGDLPDEIVGPVVNDEFGDVFGTLVALTGEGFSYAELKEIADDCRNELLLSNEISKVDIHGIQEERVFVEFNNARLAELGISHNQLKTILEARNIINPGGEIYTDDEQIVLEPTGNFESVDELRRTVIGLPEGRELVYLGDIVEIRRGYIDPPNSKVRYFDRPCLVLAVNMHEGGNSLTLGNEVKRFVQCFQEAFPIGIEFDIVTFQPFFVEKKVSEFTVSIFQAIVIVFLVMLLFLGLRTGLIVASLIPMAMVSAVLCMSFMNIGLDQMSLASLIIALGMLVDNAIVMSESIMTQMAAGKKPIEAAVESARELRIPLLTSSLTTAAAFLSIFLAESTVGEYTAPIFKVVTITLLCSWILSLTMTPLLCVKFLKVKNKITGQDRKETDSFNSLFYRGYRACLLLLLRFKGITVIAAITLFAVALFGMGFVPKIFFPPNDKPICAADLQLPIGTPIEKTEAMVCAVEKYLLDNFKTELKPAASTAPAANFGVRESWEKEGVTDWVSFIGKGAPRYVLGYSPEPPAPENAYIIINGTSLEVIKNEVIPGLKSFCFENFPDVTPKIRLLQLGPPVDNPIEIRVSGKDADRLFTLVDLVKERLSRTPGVVNITDDWGCRTKKLVVRVNQPRAQRSGLTSMDVALSLQTVLSGFDVTDYREGDEVIPVTLRSVAADRQDMGKLESHNIYVQTTGQSVPLKQVADIEVAWQHSKILRRDRLKTVTVCAQVTDGTNAIAISMDTDRWLAEESRSWPVGYKHEIGGEMETSYEANKSIQDKLPIAGLIILLLLVAQFNSIRRPLIIVLTIPLGMIGVTFGLLVTKSYFGFMTLLGVVSLAGIVINNAIVLLDRIRIEIEENNLEPNRAVIEASQKRLRPILLTTATTVGGLLPLWFGGGPMWEPMAISLIFGLVFATCLTLGFVPALYSILFGVRYRGFKYETEGKKGRS